MVNKTMWNLGGGGGGGKVRNIGVGAYGQCKFPSRKVDSHWTRNVT